METSPQPADVPQPDEPQPAEAAPADATEPFAENPSFADPVAASFDQPQANERGSIQSINTCATGAVE